MGLGKGRSYVYSNSGLSFISDAPTTIHEGNTACIDQMKKGYVKETTPSILRLNFFFLTPASKDQKTEVK